MVGQLIAVAVVYFAVGEIGRLVAPASTIATVVSLPAGASLAALLLGGTRLWPAIALGGLATGLWRGLPTVVACGIAAASTSEALLGAVALRRLPEFRCSLERFADIVALTVVGAVMAPALGATVGVASLALGGVVAPGVLGRSWITWWSGDLVGVLLIAPMVLTWAATPRTKPSAAQLIESAAIGVVLTACAALVFARGQSDLPGYPILHPYLLFLPLIWAGLRYGVRGAATGMLLVAVVALWGTSAGRGDFVREGQTDSVIAMHIFLAATSIATLALGAVVSERERSRALLDKSESLLRSVLDGTNDAVYVKDEAGRYLIMNAPGARLFGLPAGAILGMQDEALFSPAEARPLLDVDREVMKTGEPQESDEQLTIAGQSRVYHTTKAPYRDRAGKLVGVIGISRDVTARRRAERELAELRERRRVERELRELEERQRLAVEAAHLGTWFWDLKTEELVCSLPWRTVHGIGADEAISYARFLAAIHPDDRDAVAREVQRSIDDHTSYRGEHRAVWPDGTVRWVAGFGRVFYDEAGAPERMLGVSMDITAQKRSDEEHAELLLREQTARAEAQAAARAKDEFLAVLSHELRTPLQSMLGWTQMLRAGRVDPSTAEKGLETIERNVRTQAQLIEDLLDISRIVAGTIRLDRRSVSLGSVVESAIASAASSAAAKSIRIDATIARIDDEVLGDRDRLEQVVSNLIGNAVKFTPSGGRVTVRLGCDRDAAHLVVEDTGRGIPGAFLPHVFERFRQAESTTRRAHGGLGIGLSIARHIVELHGGTVTAESAGENQGATFTVTLPLAHDAQNAVASRRRSPTLTPASASTALIGARVLVVDDDADTCELLAMVLHDVGAEVTTVQSARAALDAIASRQPDLLVSDVGMPVEDGYALIRQVRASEAAAGGHLRAVALTAFASRADREQALSLGFDEHIAKPVSPDELTQTAARLLRLST